MNKPVKAIALLLAAAMMFSASGCKDTAENETGGVTSVTESTGTKDETEARTAPAADPVTENDDKKIKITPTSAKSVQFENYETADFSITIPKGWVVTTGGVNIKKYVFVNDPEEPRNTVFFILKMEPLLHSQTGKDVWQKMYNSGDQSAAQFAQAPVLQDPSTEGLFKTSYRDFTVIDRCKAQNGYGAFSLGDEILRAYFTDNAGPAEGLFTASVVDFGQFPISDGTVINYQLQTVDGGYYMAYNVTGITAAKDTLLDWSEVLFKCLSSLKFTDSFINATNKASNDQLALSKQISQNFNESMNSIMSAWENRSRSQDIMSQKQSDATLGYERVYDIETDEVYRATNGFTDDYNGERFKAVTDDNMYSQAVSGYIERID